MYGNMNVKNTKTVIQHNSVFQLFSI